MGIEQWSKQGYHHSITHENLAIIQKQIKRKQMK
ncbi:hypothetical protein AAZX31_02G071000 [Glycine max]